MPITRWAAVQLAQAQTYADILQMPLSVVYTPADLSAAIAQYKETDVIIIDTPGRNPHRTAEILELTTLLAPLPSSRRVMLVASATAKLRDLLETAAAFKGLGTHGLIFTKLDETDSFGALHSLAAITNLPAAYFCSGPRAPQDIEPASTEKLVSLMFGEGE
jgi:flagellar biosynthesis protein FlhF